MTPVAHKEIDVSAVLNDMSLALGVLSDILRVSTEALSGVQKSICIDKAQKISACTLRYIGQRQPEFQAVLRRIGQAVG